MTLRNVLLFLVMIGSPTFAESTTLLTQVKTAAIPKDFSGQPFPRFKNGFVLAFDFDLARIACYDRNGRTQFQVPLSVAGATRVQIRDIAAAPDGTVAVTGSAVDDQGRTAPVIIWINPTGSVKQIVRTTPFSALRLAFTPDASLWAAGRVYDAPQLDSLATYDVLRRYDAAGRVQQTALPNVTFSSATPDPALGSFLATSNDRIGFLSTSAKEYVEMSFAGDVLGRWKISSSLDRGTVAGTAILTSGAVFISLYPTPADFTAGKYQGPRVYRLDKRSSLLEPVQLSLSGGPLPSILLGGEGDQLVFYSKPPAAVGWFSVQ